MGRTPKPADEKAMTGAGHRPAKQAKAPPPSTPAVFSWPVWLTRKDARAIWLRVVPELSRANIMTEVFRDVIGRYCQHFADWIKVSKQIERQGVTILVLMTNGKGKMRRINPAIRVRETLEKSLLDIEDRYGISPIARYRIVAHQAAHPGQRDLFRDQPASPDDDSADPHAPLPAPPRSTAIGLLN